MYKQRGFVVLFCFIILIVNLGAASHAPLTALELNPPFGYGWAWTPISGWVDISSTGTQLFTDPGIDLNNANQIIEEADFLSDGFWLFDEHYSHVYVNTNGVLIFPDADMNNLATTNDPIPFDAPPNGLVAGFWADLDLLDDELNPQYPSVYYQRFTGSGNPPACAGVDECLVIQWTRALELGNNDGHRNTFQIVLLENNNIHFLYETMQSPSNISTIGLEGEDGVFASDKVYYKEDVSLEGNELVYTYPSATLRHKARPVYQSQFLSRNGNLMEQIFSVTVTNNGTTGASDIYTISLDPASTLPDDWEVEFPSDTGLITQGSSVDLQVKVTAPLIATVGQYADVKMRFTSQDGLRAVDVRLFAAYAAPFSQIVHNDDLIMRTMWSQHQVNRMIKEDFTGKQMGLAHMNGLNYFVAWEKRDNVIDGGITYFYSDIEYAFVSTSGSGYPNVLKNTQHHNTLGHPLDNSPAVVVGPDGRPAYAFIREAYTLSGGSLYKIYNVGLTILNPDGSVASSILLTDNTLIYLKDTGAPKFQNPRLAVTTDGKYVASWTKIIGSSNDVDMAVVNPNGGINVPPSTAFESQDIVGDSEKDIRYYEPGITVINGTKILLAASRYSDVEERFRIVYKLYDVTSKSFVVAEDASRTWFGGAPDAVQLRDGQVLLAWNDENTGITYTLLDSSGNVTGVPINLLTQMPDARSQASVSVTWDVHGNGIMTWLDSYDNRMYYALVGSDGQIKTPPMILVQGDYTSPVRSSQLGYGNAFFDGRAYNYLPLLMR
ncbi:MAG: hypothetical protein JW987_17115 [Anaerolineaceae bacterium]|nr:hypothetical protein [Anaerolineaceae bacterium]